MKKTYIIDYGVGNLKSVFNAFAAVGYPAIICKDPSKLHKADRVVLPGVGAFGDGIRNINTVGWREVLEKEVIKKQKPFLGFCLGMQLLASWGFEHGKHEGLGWIKGSVQKLKIPKKSGLRIPHIGWNNVRYVKRDGLYKNMDKDLSFYFVHSYILIPDNKKIVSALCNYGSDFVASIEYNNISATQYHPEKSHSAGLSVIRNFISKYT